jgi:purine-binding chemotaxis protein CheW
VGENPKIALYEEDLYEKAEQKDESRRFVVFRVVREWFGVDIAKVREVIEGEKITPVPSAPPHIAGIFSLRGNILSATDLRSIFHFSREKSCGPTTLVIVKSGILETGLLADEIEEPMEVPLSGIDPALSTLSPEQSECIEGQFKIGKKLVGVLKVEKILGKNH